MKTVVIFQDGALQLVLTPETELERQFIEPNFPGRGMPDLAEMQVCAHWGGYYNCNGGFYRQSTSQDSLIITFTKPPARRPRSPRPLP